MTCRKSVRNNTLLFIYHRVIRTANLYTPAILTRTMNNFYLNTFEFNAEVPEHLNNDGLIRGQFIVKCSFDSKNKIEGIYLSLIPSLSLHLARYSNRGNFTFLGPFTEESCYE